MLARGRLVVGLSVVVAAGVAFAAAARLAEDAPASADTIDAQIEATPPERYADVANDALTAMRATMQKGLDEVKRAHDEKDAVRVTCVNEPVTTMKGVMRVGEDANTALLEAIGTQNTSDASREFRKLKKSQKRMDALLAVARSCAGASSSESTTAIELSIDESLIGSDPYYGNADFFFDPQSAVANGDRDQLGQTDDVTVRPPPASGIS